MGTNGPISLDSLVASLANISAGPAAAYQQAAGANASLTGQIAEANYQMGQQAVAADITMKQAENAREADAQAAKLGIVKRLGLDPNVDTSQFSQLASTLDQKQKQLQMTMLDMEQLRGVSIADNPIQWIINQIKLDQKGAQFEQYSREADVTAKLMHERAAAGSEAMQTVLAMKQITTQEERDAALQKISLVAQTKLNQQLVQDSFTGAGALKAVLDSSLEDIRIRTDIYQLKMGEAEKSRQRVLDSVNLEAAQLRLKEAKGDINKRDSYEALVRETAKRLYGKEFDARIPLAALEGDQAIHASLIPMAATGGNALGFGPLTTYNNIMKAGGALFEPSWRKGTKDYLAKESAAAMDAAVKQAAVSKRSLPKKEAELDALVDKELRAKIAKDSEGVIDDFAPHAMHQLGFYANQNRLKNLKLWKETPIGKLNPTTTLTTSAITSYAAEAVVSGVMTSGRAAQELAAFMQIHADLVNLAVNPSMFGLPSIKKVNSRVNILGSGIFGFGRDTRIVNLLNAGEAELAINAKIAEATRSAALQGAAPNNAADMFKMYQQEQ